MSEWITPSALDREHWRWHGMKPQRGGWIQSLWIAVQDEWRKAVLESNDAQA